MSVWFDKNWINRISLSLEGFQWNSDNSANFRCPICGDSQKNRLKKRGYFYINKGHWSMKCHNCGTAVRFSTFVKIAFPHLYQEYKIERLKEQNSLNIIIQQDQPTKDPSPEPEELFIPDWTNFCTPLSSLPREHPAVAYVLSRKTPEKRLERIFYTENLDDLVRNGFGIKNRYLKEGKSTIQSNPMIFFPITDESDEIMGIQARSYSKKDFITLMFDKDFPKVYGLGEHDPNKPTFVFEAAFCQQFVPNSLALLGATAPQKMSEFVRKDKTIMVFDNEPRSKDTIQRMQKAIDCGYRVAFWPQGFIHKDLNDYMRDDPRQELKSILKQLQSESYNNGRAKLKLSQWQKIGASSMRHTRTKRSFA